MSNINPAVSVPQAQRRLRVGSKGWARAKAAAAEGKDPPESKPDDDDDDGDGDEKGKAKAAHDAAMDRCAETHADAAAKAKAAKGTDSAAALMAYEAAHDEAMEAGKAGKTSCMKMRGVAPPTSDAPPPPDKKLPPPPPAPGAAQALAALAGPGETQLQIAQLAAIGRDFVKATNAQSIADAAALVAKVGSRSVFVDFVLGALGEQDIARARGTLAATLDLAKRAETDLPAALEANDAARRERAWNKAIRAGAFSSGQVWAQIEGPKGERSSAYSALAAGINAQHADVVALEAYLERAPKLAPRGRAADADPTAQRTAQGAMDASTMMLPETVALAQKNKIDPGALAQMTAALFANVGA